ncbi:MAG TPA: SlyX family protein [Myxococcales bacterium]|jgi:uncharacterized coiled-coil protein SlyX
MDKRLTDLEVKVAYLEKAHDELSEVVRELYAQLASLTREIRGQERGGTAEPKLTLEDEKPPHY